MKSHMYHRSKIYKAVSVLLIFFCLVNLFTESSLTVFAQGTARMSGLSELVTESETEVFTIVEIVPNHGMDSIGYLVDGIIPDSLYFGLDQVTDAKERKSMVKERLNQLTIAGLVTAKSNFYQEKEGNGDQLETQGNSKEVWHSVGTQIFGRAAVNSSDLFSKMIFESNLDSANPKIHVITVTPDEFETQISNGSFTYDDIDLLYLSDSGVLNLEGGTEYDFTVTGGNDISWETGVALYQKVVENSLPVVLDYHLIENAQSAASAYGVPDTTSLLLQNSNLYRLSALLTSNEMTTTMRELFMIDQTGNSWNEEVIATVKNHQIIDTDHEFVNESVYVTNLQLADQKVLETFYSVEAVEENLSAVTNALLDEEFLLNAEDKIKTLTEVKDAATGSQISIAPASVLKYILNIRYSSQTVYKTSIHILCLEPSRFHDEFNEEIVRTWLGTNSSDQIETISIDYMTTSEFIGVKSNLRAEYDMIYIGTNIGDGVTGGSYPVRWLDNAQLLDGYGNVLTDYNDSAMDRLIYTHMGDLLTIEAGGEGEKQSARYGGNDISKEKMEELKAFADTGYPLVFSRQFFSNSEKSNTITGDYIDRASYMYELADTIKNYSNVLSTAQMPEEETSGGSSLLMMYLNMAKLSIEVSNAPKEMLHLKASGDGTYQMNYSFTLTTSGIYTGKGVFTAKLFIDADADGQYTPSEQFTNMQITKQKGNAPVASDALQAGVSYQVSIAVPEGYTGDLPWELMITETGISSGIVGTVTGNALAPDDMGMISVLQIVSEEQGFNLQKSLEVQSSLLYKMVNADIAKSVFNIEVETITVEEFTKNVYNYQVNGIGRSGCSRNLSEYDMLMLSLSDDSTTKWSQSAMDIIIAYVESGKPVLVTNDGISISMQGVEEKESWEEALQNNLRNLLGQDRYGQTEDSLWESISEDVAWSSTTNGELLEKIASLQKDYAFEPIVAGNVTGVERTLISPYIEGYTSSFLNMHSADESQAANLVGMEETEAETASIASRVNHGMIDTYPYVIPQNMIVADANAGIYQLDLKRDYDGDGTSDTVVWYCLNSGRYGFSPRDVRNNYYLYQIGNVTYTAFGASAAKAVYNEDETKLFVNTLVAAYRAGYNEPSVDFYRQNNSRFELTNFTYVTYQNGEIIEADKSLEIYYEPHDCMTLAQADKEIHYAYFYQTDSEDEADIETVIDGRTMYLKQISEANTYQIQNEVTSISVDSALKANQKYLLALHPASLSGQLLTQLEETGQIPIYVGIYTIITPVNEEEETYQTPWNFSELTLIRVNEVAE